MSSSSNSSSIQLIPFSQLTQATLCWTEMLGSGSFGEVYAGTWRGSAVAVKRAPAVELQS
jgi:predicted Ser/Thr protein kinase